MNNNIIALSQRQDTKEKLNIPVHPEALQTRAHQPPLGHASQVPGTEPQKVSYLAIQVDLVPEPHHNFTHFHCCFIPVSTQRVFPQPLAVLIGISRKREMYGGVHLENK